jgi:hypothetical protein
LEGTERFALDVADFGFICGFGVDSIRRATSRARRSASSLVGSLDLLSVMSQPLSAARLKLERAKQHIMDFNREGAKFFSSGAFEFTVGDDPKAGQRSVRVKAHKPVPEQLGLIMGDAIHNMRAALDLMTWEVLAPHKPWPPSSVQFPVGKDRNHFLKEMIPSRKINLATPEIIRAFNELQAYEGGKGDALWRIHYLDVADKHQILLPSVSTASLAAFSPTRVDPGFPGLPFLTTPSTVFRFFGSESQNLFTWPTGASSAPLSEARRRLKDYANRYKTFAIAFGTQAKPYAMGLVVPKLLEFAKAVDAAIDSSATALT